MKSSCYNIFLLFVLPWLFPNHAYGKVDTSVDEADLSKIEEVTSSSFEMVLYPTPLKLDFTATDKVADIIKNLLSVSSSSSNIFSSFDTIEISIQSVKFMEDYKVEHDLMSAAVKYLPPHVQASLVEFQITVGLNMQNATSSAPSQFTLDSLVVRTFSQPSTKSNFVDLIAQTMDPFLIEVKDIDMNLVEESSDEKAPIGRFASVSRIDIILLIVSSLIFLGIFSILRTHFFKDSHEDVSDEGSFNGKNDTNPETVGDDIRVDGTESRASNNAENGQIPLGEALLVVKNIVETGSRDSSIESQSQVVLSVINESSVMSLASSSSCNSTSGSSSSFSSASISSNSKNFCTSSEASIEILDASIDSGSVESKSQHESRLVTDTTDNLASKLLSLSGSDVYAGRFRSNKGYSSTASAPAILEDMVGKWKNESAVDKTSIKSTRSTAPPECLGLSKKRKSSGLFLHPFLKNQFVMNGFIMLGTTEEFHSSWLESKRKALDDIEEGSVEDVFQIDIQRKGDEILSKETVNGEMSTPVSEWMKMIRVVKSASETQPSSSENTSVELRSFLERENCSLDLSLEDSMAKSAVDPDVN
jgi:hypothetical protein